jgi:hypothetical protein
VCAGRSPTDLVGLLGISDAHPSRLQARRHRLRGPACLY